jgi:16S rRNA (guanine527-N7)-methyltransferase
LKKEEIIKRFLVKKNQEILIEKYLELLIDYNSHTNLVGKSTLFHPWNSHILDSLQIISFIKNKNNSILDMGTGAGLPGIILNIFGCKKVTLVDSNGKKIKFLKHINAEMSLGITPLLTRLEKIKNLKFDILTSRALANLDKLFTYSQKFLKKNTVLIFLKGKTVNEEIDFASKGWIFDIEQHQSISDQRGSLIIIKNLKKND